MTDASCMREGQAAAPGLSPRGAASWAGQGREGGGAGDGVETRVSYWRRGSEDGQAVS